jgi:predicted DNA-binding protein (MmcQ/YjbR family)
MNIESYLDFCLSLPFAEESTPFGDNTLVMKVKGKAFALFPIEPFVSVNLKCDPELAIELREKYHQVTPGFHMNKKHWNTIMVNTGLSDTHIKQWTEHSYRLVVDKLPAKDKKEVLAALSAT